VEARRKRLRSAALQTPVAREMRRRRAAYRTTPARVRSHGRGRTRVDHWSSQVLERPGPVRAQPGLFPQAVDRNRCRRVFTHRVPDKASLRRAGTRTFWLHARLASRQTWPSGRGRTGEAGQCVLTRAPPESADLRLLHGQGGATPCTQAPPDPRAQASEAPAGFGRLPLLARASTVGASRATACRGPHSWGPQSQVLPYVTPDGQRRRGLRPAQTRLPQGDGCARPLHRAHLPGKRLQASRPDVLCQASRKRSGSASPPAPQAVSLAGRIAGPKAMLAGCR